MLGKEDFMVIQALVKRGVYICDIARQLGLHPKTVSRALARGSAPAPTRTARTSLLDPYRAQIDQLLDSTWLSWDAIRGKGRRPASLITASITLLGTLQDRPLLKMFLYASPTGTPSKVPPTNTTNVSPGPHEENPFNAN